jgi:glycine cleavage system H protein
MAPLRKATSHYPLIPEEERACVWMTTGFIAYKLCDKGHQCETCPLDQAIKNEEWGKDDFRQPEEHGMEGSPEGDPSIPIDGSVFYHPDHCWVQVKNPEEATVGIDDLLSQLITDAKVVILPQPGSFTGQGECCAHIIQDDHILPVVSPLSGSVRTVNHRLKQEPELVIADPRGEGWLMTIKPGNLESDLNRLLFGRKALAWRRREEKAIVARMEQLLLKQNPRDVGPTMQDGGVRIDRLQEMLKTMSPSQRTQVLDSTLSDGRRA